jgi:hypothetical protein
MFPFENVKTSYFCGRKSDGNITKIMKWKHIVTEKENVCIFLEHLCSTEKFPGCAIYTLFFYTTFRLNISLSDNGAA